MKIRSDNDEVGNEFVIVHMTRKEADDLIASLRHVNSGGNMAHNEATPTLHFTAELLINSYTRAEDK